jgi:hypothetical protein
MCRLVICNYVFFMCETFCVWNAGETHLECMWNAFETRMECVWNAVCNVCETRVKRVVHLKRVWNVCFTPRFTHTFQTAFQLHWNDCYACRTRVKHVWNMFETYVECVSNAFTCILHAFSHAFHMRFTRVPRAFQTRFTHVSHVFHPHFKHVHTCFTCVL